MKKIIFCALLLALSACSSKMEASGSDVRLADAAAQVREQSAGAAEPMRRYLALRHRVTLSVPEQALSQRFSAIQAECLKLGCEILGAEQSAKMHRQDARATLTARVPPAAFAGFFKGLQAHGRLLSQSSTSEDKSAEVVDVEARIKNLEALKARVLDLMAKQAGNLQDLLAAEKQLAETQAALDSIHAQRRVLARDTDMVRLDIELVSESAGDSGGTMAPVARALDESGEVLIGSVGALITFCVAVVPWALLGALLLWPARRAWRRRKAAKAATALQEK